MAKGAAVPTPPASDVANLSVEAVYEFNGETH
jgi:hypothetical protein